MTTVREALVKRPHHSATTELRLKVYAALAAWPTEISTQMPKGWEIAQAAGVREAQMSTMFGAGKLPVLDPSFTFESSAHRAIAEAKEFCWEDYQQGWSAEHKRLRLARRQRVSSLVRVYASWASHHPGLSMLADRALPPGIDQVLVGKPFEVPLREILSETAVRAAVERNTPANCESLAGQKLATLDLDDPDDLDHRAAQIAGSVSTFVLDMRQSDATWHPDLLFVLRRAVAALSASDGTGD